jgi:hypothetical protein
VRLPGRDADNISHGPQTGSVRVAELARVPFLLYPKATVLRVLIDKVLGYSILPEHALRRRTPFLQTFRVEGHPITRGLALAMVRTDYPRKLTVSIAESLRALLTA